MPFFREAVSLRFGKESVPGQNKNTIVKKRIATSGWRGAGAQAG